MSAIEMLDMLEIVNNELEITLQENDKLKEELKTMKDEVEKMLTYRLKDKEEIRNLKKEIKFNNKSKSKSKSSSEDASGDDSKEEIDDEKLYKDVSKIIYSSNSTSEDDTLAGTPDISKRLEFFKNKYKSS